MIISDGKKVAALILARKDGGSESKMPVKNEDEINPSDEALHAIAEDFLQAVNDKSVLGVKSALQAFVQEIQASDEKQDEELMED